MKRNKGQALVEFIIVLPVLLLIIMAMVDFGNIISKKYSLENDLDTIVDLYNNQDEIGIHNYLNDNKLNVEYHSNGKYTQIKIIKNVKVVTPILNNVIGKNYGVSASRTIVPKQVGEEEPNEKIE